MAAANQDLAEFWGVLEEYESDPQGVKARLYSKKVSEMLGKIGTVRIVPDGDTNIFINPAVPESQPEPPAEAPAAEEDPNGKS